MKKTAQPQPMPPPPPQSQGQGDQFERSFADLAYSYIKDKAPRLLDSMIGFQVVDKNDENTHAIGIFGFQLGRQVMYAPVFFLNGELKGNQLLYVKDQDMFCPMDEPWVNYMLSRKPAILGTGVQDKPELGISAPDFELYRRSPLRGWSKTSSFGTFDEAKRGERYGYWWRGDRFDLTPAAAMFYRSPADARYTKVAARLDLRVAMPRLGPESLSALSQCVQQHPKFASLLTKFYNGADLTAAFKTKKATAALQAPSDQWLKRAGMDRGIFNYTVRKLAKCDFTNLDGQARCVADYLVTAGIKSARDIVENLDTITSPNVKIPEPAVSADVEIITSTNKAEGLTDDEKTELIQEGLVVRDSRRDDQRSKVFDAQDSQEFDTPTCSGLYDVMAVDGKAHCVLVCTDIRTIGTGVANGTYVVDPDGKGMLHCRSEQLFARTKSLTAYLAMWDKLPGVKSMKLGKRYVILAPDGTTTVPFRVTQTSDNGVLASYCWVSTLGSGMYAKGYGALRIDHHHDARRVQDPESARKLGEERSKNCPVPCDVNSDTVVEGLPIQFSRQSSFNSIGDTLFCPETFKALEIESKTGYDISTLDWAPGSLATIEALLIKTACVPLKLRSDGLRVYVGADRLDKVAAVQRLITEYGVGGEAAIQMTKAAMVSGEKLYWIKSAQNPAMVGSYTTSPDVHQLDNVGSFNADLGVNETQSQAVDTTVPMEVGSARDYNVYDTTNLQQRAQDAAKTGQKDVFDVAVLGGLTKLVGVNDEVDKYLKDLAVGMDRTGRILFLFYWHNDKFKDRYGEGEMRELEDGLKATFLSLGDIVLFLKKRSLEEDVGTAGTDVDLGDTVA